VLRDLKRFLKDIRSRRAWNVYLGFVPARVVRQAGRRLAVKFEQTASVDHDLLIRKLFTSGFDTTSVSVSTWSATVAMLRSIWSTRAELPATDLASAADTAAALVRPATATELLPPESLVVRPRPPAKTMTDLVQNRRALVA